MINTPLYRQALASFQRQHGRAPTVAAYAPGRVEILGNHTDYNEGFVLSAAINHGTFFLCAPRTDGRCRLTAGDIDETVEFSVGDWAPSRDAGWSNYVRGVCAGLAARQPFAHGFDALFLGDIPLGAGLSSSAALEMGAGLALARLYGMDVPPLDLARIGQAAEHQHVGVKCGLLDQISSLFARADELVMSDFRSLEIKTVPLGECAAETCFLMCNTGVKHRLVDSAYNERRAACETAARHFATVLPHPVKALRDVSLADWELKRDGLDPVAARRAAHVIGENSRVITAREALRRGALKHFGELMFQSHESSRVNFENSCPELDFVVETAARLPGVLGARLSGGGFGGSAVVLVHPRDAATAAHALATAYQRRFGYVCEARVIRPSAGAAVMGGEAS